MVYFDISRSEPGQTCILVEKESACQFWQGKVTSDFISKINTKFNVDYTHFSLFTKMAKAMISGDSAVVFDWLTSTDLTSMMKQSGRDSLPSSSDLQDRVLVMIESSGERRVNVPIPLMAYDERQCDQFYQVAKRLKMKAEKKTGKEGLFLTGAEVVQNEEADLLREENNRLRREMAKMRGDAKQAGERSEQMGRDRDDTSALRSKLADLQLELSALPVLKNQLKEKVKELEIMHMYVREVEICSKIRAPMPNLNSYKKSLMGNGYESSSKEQLSGNKKKPAVTTTARGRNINNMGSRNIPGTAPAKKSLERKPLMPSKALAGVYKTTASGVPSRKASNSTNF